ncbi:MAG: TIGR04086 family membrane protein [Erysipelotrichales bacterium]|nr:TIGR04086 family membrane protein [Erysipelotrichales bacterium]
MSLAKKTAKIYLIFGIISLLSVFTFALLVMFNRLPSDDNSLSRNIFFTGLALFLILGFISGNCHHKKGVLIGLIYSSSVILLALLVNYLGFDILPDLMTIVKWGAFIVASITGAVIGVNFKKFI